MDRLSTAADFWQLNRSSFSPAIPDLWAAAGPMHNEKLVLQEQVLGQEASAAPGPEERGNSEGQMDEQNNGDFHASVGSHL